MTVQLALLSSARPHGSSSDGMTPLGNVLEETCRTSPGEKWPTLMPFSLSEARRGKLG